MAQATQGAKIDRLLIDVPGGSPGQGRELAQLVAAGLAQAGALPQGGDMPRLSVTLTTNQHEDVGGLARRIVAATLRALAREP
jgi:hypothetical protein